MGISITLYHLAEPTNVVNKTLDGTSAITLNAQLEPTGPINLVNPVFIVDTGVASTYSNLSSMNYLYAGAPLNRYYFITSLDFTVAKKAVIACHVDVLMTFRNRINTTTLNFTRGYDGINEIEDNSYPLGDYITTETFKFTDWDNSNFSNNDGGRRYILRVAAGSVVSGTEVHLTVGGYAVYSKWKYDVNGPADNAYLTYNSEAPGDTTNPRIRPNSIIIVDNTYKYRAKITGVEADVPAYIQLDPLF